MFLRSLRNEDAREQKLNPTKRIIVYQVIYFTNNSIASQRHMRITSDILTMLQYGPKLGRAKGWKLWLVIQKNLL